MIPGIVAAQALAAGGASSDNPTMVMDFIAGIYTVDGTAYTVNDAIDLATSANVVSGSGLELEGDPDGVWPVEVLAPFSTRMLTYPATMVIDYEILTFGSEYLFMHHALYSPGPNDSVFAIDQDSNSVDINDHSETLGDSRFVQDFVTSSAGRHKIAVTYSTSKLVLSYDGRAIVNTAPQGLLATPLLQKVAIGGVTGIFASGNPGWNLRKIEIYGPVADVNLPTLSAL